MQVQQSRAASACSCSGRLQLVATPSCRPFTGRAMSQRGPAQQRATAAAAALEFAKYQGLGNDFILVDNRGQDDLMVSAEQAVALCDRNFGIGGDGVIFALPPKGDTDYSMRIWNSDGSEPEMCGNGIRCLAHFIAERDGHGPGTTHRIHTLAGLIQPRLTDDGLVCVDMGPPIFEPSQVPTTLEATKDGAVVAAELEVGGRTWTVSAVSMGNPHAIVYASSDGPVKIDELDLAAIGPQFESHSVFPAKTNTEFVEVVNREHVRMKVWERGAGPTLACGTGACALVVAGILEGRLDRNRPCRVDLPGGPLTIEWRGSEGHEGHVLMTGPGELVFAGSVNLK
mmetsp:Transcript_15982/g.48004  ORF Transcript_15982/g.48004 Transcript_15982/m.48004 type:complete len:341 (-) Transcript_15982:480-1502(-)